MTSMSTTRPSSTRATVLGLGAMGTALAGRLLDQGHAVTVWNRTPGRTTALAEDGARPESSALAAVAASPLLITCLLRHGSVLETLEPVADALGGRVLVNLTTTTPTEARELDAWARRHGVVHLDGAVLAVPDMIGTPASQLFFSGSRPAFDEHRDVLDAWGTTTFEGEDPGLASLLDLAMLSAMYQMFAGFLHGAAMAGSEGMSAGDFAARSTPFLAAMTEAFAEYADVVDSGDYAAPGQQSLDFSDLSHLVRASDEQGVDSATLAAVQALIARQVADGHGADGLPRIIESLRAGPTPTGRAGRAADTSPPAPER